MEEIIRIAIDGPSGAGKSTIAKELAKRLSMEYVDTGAMYRAIGYKMRSEGVAPTEMDKIQEVLERTTIDFEDGIIYLDGEDVGDKIRTPEMSIAASQYSQLAPVREKLVEVQREIGHRRNVVMDGRDIGTNVFTDAQYKFFLTASAEERAKRRMIELRQKGEDTSFEDVLIDIEKRDFEDTHRKLNPLKKAEDAIVVDSTKLTIEEVVGTLYDKIVK